MLASRKSCFPGARINWMFTTDKARAKMSRVYPVTSKEVIITVMRY